MDSHSGATRFDRLMVQDPIRLGQRISAFSIRAHAAGEWVRIADGTTIGYKRLLRVPPVETQQVRIEIEALGRALPAPSR